MPSLTPTSISYPFKHPSRLLPTPAIHYKLNKFFGNSGGGGGRNEWCLGLGRDLWRDSCTSPFPPTSPNKKIDNIVWVRGVGPSGGPLAPGPLHLFLLRLGPYHTPLIHLKGRKDCKYMIGVTGFCGDFYGLTFLIYCLLKVTEGYNRLYWRENTRA